MSGQDVAGRGRWWRVLPAGVAGVACAACCLRPGLIAAVVAGGGVLGVLLGWLPEIALALVAIAVIVLLVPLSRGGCTGLVARGCVRVRPPRRRNGGVSEAT